MHLRGHRRLTRPGWSSSTCCIWSENKVLAQRRLRNTAGHWPLDRYYRCNIVNNVPLKRSHGFISAQVTADLPRGTGQTHREPTLLSLALCISTYKTLSLAEPFAKPLSGVYCWIFILWPDTAVNTECLHINQWPRHWPLSRHPFCRFYWKIGSEFSRTPLLSQPLI